MTKIVFMGTPAFSVPILEALIDSDEYRVIAVVTQPDRPVGRKRILTPTPVKEAALAHSIEILQPEKISGSVELERILELKPDLIVTAAFGQFLPEKLLNAPIHGAINVHASLLPKYRGGAPVHYSIIKGDEKTGVTIMEMVKKMDAGDIISQAEIPITKQDDVGSMFGKLSLLGRDLLLATLPDYLAGKIETKSQAEDEVTFSPNITRDEEQIDWKKTSVEIDCQIRGMRPWPVAFTTFQEKRWKIWEVTVMDEKTTEVPGTIIEITKKYLKIACGDNTVLRIDKLQPAGKGQLTAQDFLNGLGKEIVVGDKVE